MFRVVLWIIGWIVVLSILLFLFIGMSSRYNWFDEDDTQQTPPTVDVQPSETGHIILALLNEIEIGMTYDEVYNILGSEGISMGVSDFGLGEDHIIEIYQWVADDNDINLLMTFQGGKLVRKHQIGFE